MPVKTDRILAYLPPTFRAAPAFSALRAFVNGFGAELQQGENQLAEVMQSHWVDFADRGAAEIVDLGQMAALYGLAPRHDESVEVFREHLKRYVRTFLEGTVTVQGILRITAETLGLTIADAPDQLDVWWKRASDELLTREAVASDAAALVLGMASVDVRGTAAGRAEIAGTVDLRTPVDLSDRHMLYVVVDEGVPVAADLAAGAADPAAVSLAAIEARLREALGDGVVRIDEGRLVLASQTLGPDSHLEVREGPDDAATAVMGLLPLTYRGRAETRARLTGTVELSAGVDLSEHRYLRLVVDGTHLAEIDCAGGDPSQSFLDEIRDAINDGLGIEVATHDGRFLSLVSPSTGHTSTIGVLRAAAQDAAERLFGPVLPLYAGEDPQPADFTGTVDLSEGADLRGGSLLRLHVDDLPTVTVDCAGAVPAHTTLDEILVAVNTAVGAEVALRAGNRLRLRSPSTGELAEIILDTLPDDAAPALLGIPPRSAAGSPATVAHVTGTASHPAGISLVAQHLLEVAVDGGPFVRIDLRSDTGPRTGVLLDAVEERINTALGDDVATHDGERLILRSREPGGGSRIEVRPITFERRRRFVSRAFLTGEASQTLFGVDTAVARGDDASRASVTGSTDLRHSVDLTANRFLRLRVDDRPAVEIDCAGGRPRATLLDEIALAINEEVPGIASHDGHHLTLTSPTTGVESRIAFETPQAEYASALLVGVPPGTVRGSAPAGVAFVGVADLSGGVDLPAGAAVRIGVDGAAPVDIRLTGEEGAHRSLSALTAAVNGALGRSVARHDGAHLALVSPSTGAGSRLVFEVPAGGGVDATQAVFGIAAPRQYHGSDATRARLVGAVELPPELDLRIQRFLMLSVDGSADVVVDCAPPGDPEHTSPGAVVAAIDSAFQADVASLEGNRLVLRSGRTGTAGRVAVVPYAGSDARTALFGPSVPQETLGQPPLPASITGVDLLAPADLSRRSWLRIAVDGGAPRDVDVAGTSASQATLDEMVAAVNGVFPGLAFATGDRRLRLESSSVGIDSRVEILPLRSFEVVEYPPARRRTDAQPLVHGARMGVDNGGAGESSATITLSAPQGSAGPAMLNFSRGWLVQLLRPVGSGETARIWRDVDGTVRAEVLDRAGRTITVPRTEVRVSQLGMWTQVPSTTERPVPPTGVQLDNPFGAQLDQVLPRVGDLTVEVAPSSPDAGPFDTGRADGEVVEVMGLLRRSDAVWRLEDASGGVLVEVRPGRDATLSAHEGAVVTVSGPFHVADDPYVLATSLQRRFDVTLRGTGADGSPVVEHHERVTIGEPRAGTDSLEWRCQFGKVPSQLALVRPLAKGDALTLERGRSEWMLLDCRGSRYDEARFDEDRFARSGCAWDGVFDATTFCTPADPVQTVFASADAPLTPAIDVAMEWDHHEPGAFEVNLPADLPTQFGGRFDQATFASSAGESERYERAVTEPLNDDNNLISLVKARSVLLDDQGSQVAQSVPIGFQAVTLPFRRPQFLRGGAGPNHARIYLREEGARGFLKLEARQPGPVGNLIFVTARPAGPAQFDVTVATEGSRFEVARQIVAGPQAPPVDRSTVEPLPVGVREARGAGVRVAVTRDQTGRERP